MLNSRVAKLVVAWLGIVVCSSLASADVPSTQPAGNAGAAVTGKVTAESEVPLSEMVVFLEVDGDAAPEATKDVPPSVTIRQKGAKFDPPLLVVCAGQTVEFLNDEEKAVEHNVFSNAPAKKFDLGLYPPKQSKPVTFDKPGAVMLYCSIHRFMDGVVYVCPTRFHSRVAEDGTYRIENVPPGKYKLRTWQRRKRFPEKTEPLELREGGAQTINLELRRPS
ncbi:MAG: carboxypeptidase regulatory-like domain-containing protein [Tepidisphaeraceae bacterium]